MDTKEFIFKQPEKWSHIRDIARKVKLSPNTVRKQIQALEKEGINKKNGKERA